MLISKKKLMRWLKAIVAIYVVIGLGLYFFQEKFLFHPQSIPSSYKFKFDLPFEELNIPFNKTDTMNLIKFLPSDSIRKGIVIYYHGNMSNINHYSDYVKPFTKKGYEVWMEDYPSFGKSTGIINEAKLYAQAMQVKKMADAVVAEDSILIYGKSIGTGIAAYVASNSKVKLLILETPYFSIPSLFETYSFIYPTNFLSKYKIPTYEYLQKTKTAIIIFHGTNDGVIPYSNAKKLSKFLKPQDKFITIPNATHQNINRTKIYLNYIDSLLSK